MAAEEPPTNVPRIADVLNPASGHYAVIVRMPTVLAGKYPTKPWGTRIETIGLAKQESDRYPGYVLVDVEPMRGSPDLFWVFQKLDGPEWTTKSLGQDNLIPQKYRRQITTVRTKQEVEPGTEPTALGGDLTSSVVEQQDNTGKAVRVNTTEIIEENAAPLIGALTDTWGINTTEESLVVEGTPVVSGYGVKASKVDPTGDGKSVLSTERYPTDVGNDGIIYTLIGREVDETTDAVIRVSKSLVDASRAEALAAAADGYAELQPIDKWHSIMIVSKLITPPQTKTWKETGEISLPNQLSEVGVIWDSDIQGDAGSAGVDSQAEVISNNLSWSASAEASVVGSVFGRPYTKVTAGFRGAAEITVVRTFHATPPTADIAAHVFSPVYGTLTLRGVQGQHQARGTARGVGDIQVSNSLNYRRHIDTKLAITQFGPFEHVGLALTETGDLKTVTLTKTSTGGSTPDSEPYPTAVATLSLEGSVSLDIPPSSTPLGPGDTFIVSVGVSPWRYGYWVKEVRTAKIPGTPSP
jgi:hypothetical protein